MSKSTASLLTKGKFKIDVPRTKAGCGCQAQSQMLDVMGPSARKQQLAGAERKGDLSRNSDLVLRRQKTPSQELTPPEGQWKHATKELWKSIMRCSPIREDHEREMKRMPTGIGNGQCMSSSSHWKRQTIAVKFPTIDGDLEKHPTFLQRINAPVVH